jgi:hypothetical protein
VELAPAVLASGWASGVNAYLCVIVLGLFGRIGGVEAVPEALTRTDVLVVAGVLYLLEFVTDKIPYVDSAWDAISTAIRPTVGAVIGLLAAGDAATLEQALLAVAGGGAALASHLVKGGLRLVVNTSPEPVTNSAVSLGEDLAVAAVATLVVVAPYVAFGIAAALLVAGAVLLAVLWTRVRRGWRRYREWRERRAAPGDQPKKTAASE